MKLIDFIIPLVARAQQIGEDFPSDADETSLSLGEQITVLFIALPLAFWIALVVGLILIIALILHKKKPQPPNQGQPPKEGV